MENIIYKRKAKLLSLAKVKEGKLAAKARNWKEAKEYMNSEHEFILFISNVNTGIKRTMSGRDAKLKNDINTIRFGSGKNKSLNRWSPCKRIKERKKNHENVGYGRGTYPVEKVVK